MAALLGLALAGCSGGGGERQETVTENLAATAGAEAGGAAEAGRPADMNLTNSVTPAASEADATANSAEE